MKRLCILALVVLSACASKQDIGKHGYSKSYSEGYGDGCHSLKYQKIINDDNRFEDEDEYALGWADGFRSCENLAQAAKRKARVQKLNEGIAADTQDFYNGYILESDASAAGTKVRSIRIN